MNIIDHCVPQEKEIKPTVEASKQEELERHEDFIMISSSEKEIQKIFQEKDQESTNLNKETACSTIMNQMDLKLKEALSFPEGRSVKYSPGEHSARADVVRKSLIRGIKRFYSNLF